MKKKETKGTRQTVTVRVYEHQVVVALSAALAKRFRGKAVGFMMNWARAVNAATGKASGNRHYTKAIEIFRQKGGYRLIPDGRKTSAGRVFYVRRVVWPKARAGKYEAQVTALGHIVTTGFA